VSGVARHDQMQYEDGVQCLVVFAVTCRAYLD
jgi:hypothetical protein